LDSIPLHLPPDAEAAIEVATSNANAGDKKFIDNLLSGYKWQLYVLNALQAYGHWGHIHPLKVRPKSSERKDYGDAYDIVIGSEPESQPCWFAEIAVKGRTRTFTTPESFPFPTILVEQLSTFEKRDGDLPDYWCMVSQFNQSMIFLPSSESKLFEDEAKKGILYKTAPKESFLSLEAFLDSLPAPGVTL